MIDRGFVGVGSSINEAHDQRMTEVHMKKLLVLAGIAAAVFGVTKLLGRKQEEEIEDVQVAANGYVPQGQA